MKRRTFTRKIISVFLCFVLVATFFMDIIKRNTLPSIVVGTVCYMILGQMVF